MTYTDIEGEGGLAVAIVGCGSVGTALALGLIEAGVPVVGAHCKTAASAARAAAATGLGVSSGEAVPREPLERASLVILSVPDPQIALVAGRLAEAGVLTARQVALHCSGAMDATPLASLEGHAGAVGCFHPLLSFASPKVAAALLSEATFALDGDERAIDKGRALAARLGGHAIRVSAGDRVLYHAAAASASNHLVALAAQAIELLGALGISRDDACRALVPLMRSTLDNLERLGVPDALTGPVSRGDAQCVGGHLAAIEAAAPDEREPYVALARRALAVAREQGAAPGSALDEVGGLLASRARREGGDCA